MNTWKFERTETVPREKRFPPVGADHQCSQCSRTFDVLSALMPLVTFGGSFLDTPICEDCRDCLEEVECALKRERPEAYAGKIAPPFSYEEAQNIFGQALERAKKWAKENPDYMKAVDLLKPRLWAEKVYKLQKHTENK